MLTVKRKGFTRTVRKGRKTKTVRVPATTFKIRDRGRPGREKSVITIKRPRALTMLGYSTKDPAFKRRTILIRASRRHGRLSVWRMLNAQYVFRKNSRLPAVRKNAKIFKFDRDWQSFQLTEGERTVIRRERAVRERMKK